nr:MAG TPA: hypothetical protein [Caudoviricetes sp.]
MQPTVIIKQEKLLLQLLYLQECLRIWSFISREILKIIPLTTQDATLK